MEAGKSSEEDLRELEEVLKIFRPESIRTRLLLSKGLPKVEEKTDLSHYLSEEPQEQSQTAACTSFEAAISSFPDGRSDADLTAELAFEPVTPAALAPPPFILGDENLPEELAAGQVEAISEGLEEQNLETPSLRRPSQTYSRAQLQALKDSSDAGNNSRTILGAVDRARLGKSNHPVTPAFMERLRRNEGARSNASAQDPQGGFVRGNSFEASRSTASTQILQGSFGRGNSFEVARRPFNKRVAGTSDAQQGSWLRRPEEAIGQNNGILGLSPSDHFKPARLDIPSQPTFADDDGGDFADRVRYLKRRNTKEDSGQFKTGGPAVGQGVDSPSKTLAGIELGALDSFLENGAALMNAFATPLCQSPQNSAREAPEAIGGDSFLEKNTGQSRASGQTGSIDIFPQSGSGNAATRQFNFQPEQGALSQHSSFSAGRLPSKGETASDTGASSGAGIAAEPETGFGVSEEPEEPAAGEGVQKPAESNGSDDALEELLRQMEKNWKTERPTQAESGCDLARAGSLLGGLVQEETTVLSFKAVRASAVGRSVSPSTASFASEAGSAEPQDYLSELDVGTSESSPIRGQEILRAFGSGSFATGWGLETQGVTSESEVEPEPNTLVAEGSASRPEGARTEGDRKTGILAVEESRSEERPRSSPLKRPRSPSPERGVGGIRAFASELLLSADTNREKLPAVLSPGTSLPEGQETEEKPVGKLAPEARLDNSLPQPVQAAFGGSLTRELGEEQRADGLLGGSVIKEAPPPFVFGESAATGKQREGAEGSGLDLTLAAWKKDPEDPLSFPAGEGREDESAQDAEEDSHAEKGWVSTGEGSAAGPEVAQDTSVPSSEVVQQVPASPSKHVKSAVEAVSQAGESEEGEGDSRNPSGEKLEKPGPEADPNPAVPEGNKGPALTLEEELKPTEQKEILASSAVKVEEEQLKEPGRAEKAGDKIGDKGFASARATEVKAGGDASDGQVSLASVQISEEENTEATEGEDEAQKQVINGTSLSRAVRAEEAIAAAEEAADKADVSRDPEIEGQGFGVSRNAEEPKHVAEDAGSGEKADGREAELKGTEECKNKEVSEWEDVRSKEAPGSRVGEADNPPAEGGAPVQTNEQAPGVTEAELKPGETSTEFGAPETGAGSGDHGDVAGAGWGEPEKTPSDQPGDQCSAEAGNPVEPEKPAEPDAGQRNETEPAVVYGTEAGAATGWGEVAVEVAGQREASVPSPVEEAGSGWEGARGVSETSGPAVLRSSGQISTRVRPERPLDQDGPDTQAPQPGIFAASAMGEDEWTIPVEPEPVPTRSSFRKRPSEWKAEVDSQPFEKPLPLADVVKAVSKAPFPEESIISSEGGNGWSSPETSRLDEELGKEERPARTEGFAQDAKERPDPSLSEWQNGGTDGKSAGLEEAPEGQATGWSASPASPPLLLSSATPPGLQPPVPPSTPASSETSQVGARVDGTDQPTLPPVSVAKEAPGEEFEATGWGEPVGSPQAPVSEASFSSAKSTPFSDEARPAAAYTEPAETVEAFEGPPQADEEAVGWGEPAPSARSRPMIPIPQPLPAKPFDLEKSTGLPPPTFATSPAPAAPTEEITATGWGDAPTEEADSDGRPAPETGFGASEAAPMGWGEAPAATGFGDQQPVSPQPPSPMRPVGPAPGFSTKPAPRTPPGFASKPQFSTSQAAKPLKAKPTLDEIYAKVSVVPKVEGATGWNASTDVQEDEPAEYEAPGWPAPGSQNAPTSPEAAPARSGVDNRSGSYQRETGWSAAGDYRSVQASDDAPPHHETVENRSVGSIPRAYQPEMRPESPPPRFVHHDVRAPLPYNPVMEQARPRAARPARATLPELPAGCIPAARFFPSPVDTAAAQSALASERGGASRMLMSALKSAVTNNSAGRQGGTGREEGFAGRSGAVGSGITGSGITGGPRKYAPPLSTDYQRPTSAESSEGRWVHDKFMEMHGEETGRRAQGKAPGAYMPFGKAPASQASGPADGPRTRGTKDEDPIAEKWGGFAEKQETGGHDGGIKVWDWDSDSDEKQREVQQAEGGVLGERPRFGGCERLNIEGLKPYEPEDDDSVSSQPSAPPLPQQKARTTSNPQQSSGASAPRPRFARDKKVDEALAAWQAWGGAGSEPDPFAEAEAKYGPGPPARQPKPAPPTREKPIGPRRATPPAVTEPPPPTKAPVRAVYPPGSSGSLAAQTLKLPERSPSSSVVSPEPRYKRDAKVEEALSAWKALGTDPNEPDPFEEAARKYGTEPAPKPKLKPSIVPAQRPAPPARIPAPAKPVPAAQPPPAKSTPVAAAPSNGPVRFGRDPKVDEALAAWKNLGGADEPDPFEEIERRNRY
ncbi:hypothetical protein KFL_000280360 [Klebsormidium nitens]|uniref:Uncharacterized protein n=1 Tax=Klebsormidium nitens TaxID=105231 RepID=A0A1Y1HQR6_KLENI|nr:hypothetical protein KFL_000280360 [Klebsormidium nitens]|eukprot:GAQ79331.1 hypothetical protein KFL_000280360 [Klebsormidium nitens]